METLAIQKNKLPKGWEIKKLKEVCIKITRGGTPSRDIKEYWENGKIP